MWSLGVIAPFKNNNSQALCNFDPLRSDFILSSDVETVGLNSVAIVEIYVMNSLRLCH